MNNRLLLLSLFLMPLSGCGNQEGIHRVAVEGTVTIDGETIDGRVSLRPQPGTEGPLVTTTIEKGEFQLSEEDGPVPGDYDVVVIVGDVLGNRSSVTVSVITEKSQSTPAAVGQRHTTHVAVPDESPTQLEISIQSDDDPDGNGPAL